ncbi:MAG: omptin family outer membrane protease [Thermodesulfobacteriota bacterium]
MACLAFLLPAGLAGAGEFVTLEVDLQTAYRLDSLQWSIAGPAGEPNVISELQWRDLRIGEVQLGAAIAPSAALAAGLVPHAFINLGLGHIYSGEMQDSDYALDNHTQEWSRSNNQADDGSVVDLSLGLGLTLPLVRHSFSLTPLLGYSYHEQNLTITDGRQTVTGTYGSYQAPELGAIAGLDSSYESEWQGPWLGCEATLQPVERLRLSLLFTYHFGLSYWADAHWNLRDDLRDPSFRHTADLGWGYRWAVSGDYGLTPALNLFVSLDYQEFSVSDGSDWKFYTNGDVGRLALNEVNWSSRSCGTGLRYLF